VRKIAAALIFVLTLSLAPVAAAETPTASISSIVAKVSPSVVGISVLKREPADEPGAPSRLIASSGSGFIFRKGYVLSNAHVLDHGLWARIETYDGRSFTIDPAKIWSDPVSDLAVAQVAADLPAVSFAEMKQVRLGDPVFAMGAPYGLRFKGSVSRGIISGFERPLGADYTFLQTDAPINPGNSGGPLFDLQGRVVGVNARGILGADGMGFSIPADLASEVADALVRDGKVVRSWLGLRFSDGADAALGWSDWQAPVVTMVEPDGPAAKAGLQVGDSLLKLDGELVETLDDVAAFLRTVAPGNPITLEYGRGDQATEVTISASTRPRDAMLYLPAYGLWTELTAAQANLARRFGRDMAFLDGDDLLDPWTAWSGKAKALLVTEFLRVARASWESTRQDKPLTSAQAEAEAAKGRGMAEVQIDLPLSFEADPDKLWAEWTDEGGSLRAVSVRLVDGAPNGYQRVLVSFRTKLLEKRGQAFVTLHLDQGTDRRFLFDLDGIH